MSPVLIFGLLMAGVVAVPALGMLGMWCHHRRQETRCQRGLHEWGKWEARGLGVPTVLGARNVQVSVCERGCGATVRRLTAPDNLWERNSGMAERLFREASS